MADSPMAYNGLGTVTDIMMNPTRVQAIPGGADLLPGVVLPTSAPNAQAVNFPSLLPDSTTAQKMITEANLTWQDKLKGWLDNPDNQANLTLILSALGEGIAPNNPMIPAAKMAAQGAQAYKQDKSTRGYLQDMIADALNPGTATSMKVTPGKDGTSKLSFEVPYATDGVEQLEGAPSSLTHKQVTEALRGGQEGTVPFDRSPTVSNFLGMTPETVNAAITQAREIQGQRQTARLKELEQNVEAYKAQLAANAQDHRTPWQKNWEDTFAPAFARIEGMPEGPMKELNKKWLMKQAIGAGVLPPETKFEEARAAIEAVGGVWTKASAEQVAGLKTPEELRALEANAKLAEAQAQPITIRNPIDGTPMTVPLGIASELINSGKGPTMMQEYERSKAEEPDRFPHFTDYLEWYFRTQGDANMKSLARILAENRASETGRGMGRTDSPQMIEKAKEDALASSGLTKPLIAVIMAKQAEGKPLTGMDNRTLNRYKTAATNNMINQLRTLPEHAGANWQVEHVSPNLSVLYYEKNGQMQTVQVNW